MKTILIIEDDKKIAMALAVRLRAAGYEAAMAHDALSGLNTTIKIKPNLVLLDISMPAGNGFVVAERIQSLVPTLTPIIFLTASRQPGLRERAQALGAAGFFEKPFDAEELLAAIGHALGEPFAPPPPDEPETRATLPPAAPLPSATGRASLPVPTGQTGPPTPRTATPPAPARQPTRAKKRILVIEDHADTARALAVRLEAAQYEVTTAADVLLGLNLLVRDQPDLVLLDVLLPSGNGFALVELARKLSPQLPPILVMTSIKQPELRERARSLGLAGFFEKPLDTQALLATIHNSLHEV